MCWNQLKPTASKLMPYGSDLEVGLLIGINCLKAIKPRKIIPGANTDPYGIRTDLGWVIVDRESLSPSRFRWESSRGDCDKKWLVCMLPPPVMEPPLPSYIEQNNSLLPFKIAGSFSVEDQRFMNVLEAAWVSVQKTLLCFCVTDFLHLKKTSSAVILSPREIGSKLPLPPLSKLHFIKLWLLLLVLRINFFCFSLLKTLWLFHFRLHLQFLLWRWPLATCKKIR